MNKYTNEPQWCFPESAGKGNTGINANMPDSFRENPWDSLIRECCQNALDASDNDKTVILEFHLFTLPTDKIPGILDLKNILIPAMKLPKERANLMLNKFLKER